MGKERVLPELARQLLHVHELTAFRTKAAQRRVHSMALEPATLYSKLVLPSSSQIGLGQIP